jgi:hypothetical protein
VDRNPQKFVDIYKATKTDFQKAVERVLSLGSVRLVLETEFREVKLQRGHLRDSLGAIHLQGINETDQTIRFMEVADHR